MSIDRALTPHADPPESPAPKRRGFRWLALVAWLLFFGAAGAGAAAAFFYLHFMHNLPDPKRIDDYRPALTTRVLDRNGDPIATFYSERRELIPIERVPQHVIDAFVAGEDSTFFEHKGIDYFGILRAALANLRAGTKVQGASTITQQMVKGLLLTPERSYERKIKELILAHRIEQRFSKREILYLYLNQIYFGEGAYGIAEAARSYFGKDVEALSVSEGAQLAGLPKAPSRYSPFSNPERAEQRRRYVLQRMKEDRQIDEATYTRALAEPVVLAITPSERRSEDAAYFAEEVRRTLVEALGNDAVLAGGLRIETTLDPALQSSAVASLRAGLVGLDRRQGYRGHLRHVEKAELGSELAKLATENDVAEGADPETALASGKRYVGVVLAVDAKANTARVGFAPKFEALVRLSDVAWARKPDPAVDSVPLESISAVFRVGDVARFERGGTPPPPSEGAVKPEPEAVPPGAVLVSLAQDPQVQGALLSLDVQSDEVLALVGGYDFEQSQFNRVTQATRQPGSAFKPLIYGAALERGYTGATIVHDRPVVYEDAATGQVWRPQNYGREFYGPLTLREALARSVNNATVYLFRDIGGERVIDYARRLGIESTLENNLSLALGSSGVTLLELTRAYASFPAGGKRMRPVFIRRVLDRDGNELLRDVELGRPAAEALARMQEPAASEVAEETATPEVAQPAIEAETPAAEVTTLAGVPEPVVPPGFALSAQNAFLVTDLLRGVVEDPEGTGWRLRALQRPLAGKTGTTNDQADAWFMGFSPEIMTGVWVGHDESRILGHGETGSRAAAPIWVDYMSKALAQRPVADFDPPDSIVFARIDRKSGLLAEGASGDSVFQAFLEGREPTTAARRESEDEQAWNDIMHDAF
jgi:penicillin-binding protein 1A